MFPLSICRKLLFLKRCEKRRYAWNRVVGDEGFWVERGGPGLLWTGFGWQWSKGWVGLDWIHRARTVIAVRVVVCGRVGRSRFVYKSRWFDHFVVFCCCAIWKRPVKSHVIWI